jgi:cell division protein FtsB
MSVDRRAVFAVAAAALVAASFQALFVAAGFSVMSDLERRAAALDARVVALEARVTVPGSTDIPRKDQTRMEVQ